MGSRNVSRYWRDASVQSGASYVSCISMLVSSSCVSHTTNKFSVLLRQLTVVSICGECTWITAIERHTHSSRPPPPSSITHRSFNVVFAHCFRRTTMLPDNISEVRGRRRCEVKRATMNLLVHQSQFVSRFFSRCQLVRGSERVLWSHLHVCLSNTGSLRFESDVAPPQPAIITTGRFVICSGEKPN